MLSRFLQFSIVRRISSFGEIGCGVGKSGGSGGSIREAGGAFGKLEAAREESYFHNLQIEQLKTMRKEMRRKAQAQPLKPLTEVERMIAARNEQLKNIDKNVE